MASEADLLTAVKAGDLPTVQKLLAHHPDLAAAREPNGPSALLLAIYYGQPAIAEALLQTGLPLDIFEAAAAGRTDVLVALLAANPERVNGFAADGFTPLGLAAFFGHPPAVDLLLARGADPNLAANNGSHVAPLHSAAAANDVAARLRMAEALLAHGAQVNARQEGGFTPLHAAADNGDLELARLLLKHGADPRLTNGAGLTPAGLAREKGFTELSATLH